jgi:hypothetical protein
LLTPSKKFEPHFGLANTAVGRELSADFIRLHGIAQSGWERVLTARAVAARIEIVVDLIKFPKIPSFTNRGPLPQN